MKRTITITVDDKYARAVQRRAEKFDLTLESAIIALIEDTGKSILANDSVEKKMRKLRAEI